MSDLLGAWRWRTLFRRWSRTRPDRRPLNRASTSLSSLARQARVRASKPGAENLGALPLSRHAHQCAAAKEPSEACFPHLTKKAFGGIHVFNTHSRAECSRPTKHPTYLGRRRGHRREGWARGPQALVSLTISPDDRARRGRTLPDWPADARWGDDRRGPPSSVANEKTSTVPVHLSSRRVGLDGRYGSWRARENQDLPRRNFARWRLEGERFDGKAVPVTQRFGLVVVAAGTAAT